MHKISPEQPRHVDEPLPGAREVVSGIWKITLPIPFPLRTVNVYALVGRNNWSLIDAGIGTPDARMALAAGLEQAGLQIDDLHALVLTHHHPDHVGLSGELQRQSASSVFMHAIDEKALHLFWNQEPGQGQRPDMSGAFFRQHGLEPTTNWFTQAGPGAVRQVIQVPPHEAFTLVEDGELLELAGETYQIWWVPGHSDGLITLYRPRDGVFLASDHVLPRITPNIGLYGPTNRPDPLGDYLHSLQKIAALSASLVLPGHGEPLPNLEKRVQQIMQHHNERLALVLNLLAERPQHALDLTRQMFAPQRIEKPEPLRMALAEVLAHLEYLRLRSKVRQQQTDEGIILYERSA
jgi:glyoxylase-like metal-dependent hydrolase (beta-lactamase superfamily II)